MSAPAASCGLFAGQIDHTFRSTLVGLTHGQHIGGVNGREVTNVAGEGRAGQRCVQSGQIVIVFLGRITQWVGSLLATNFGCPLSRSFFARCGIPQRYTGEFSTCPAKERQGSWYPTSRERRARCAHPSV